MDRDPLEFDDEALTRYFAAANEDLSAEQFAAVVLRRAQRRTLVRTAVLGGAGVVAALIAFEPTLDTLREVVRLLLGAMSQWNNAAWYKDNALVVSAVVATVAWPLVARWLAR